MRTTTTASRAHTHSIKCGVTYTTQTKTLPARTRSAARCLASSGSTLANVRTGAASGGGDLWRTTRNPCFFMSASPVSTRDRLRVLDALLATDAAPDALRPPTLPDLSLRAVLRRPALSTLLRRDVSAGERDEPGATDTSRSLPVLTSGLGVALGCVVARPRRPEPRRASPSLLDVATGAAPTSARRSRAGEDKLRDVPAGLSGPAVPGSWLLARRRSAGAKVDPVPALSDPRTLNP